MKIVLFGFFVVVYFFVPVLWPRARFWRNSCPLRGEKSVLNWTEMYSTCKDFVDVYWFKFEHQCFVWKRCFISEYIIFIIIDTYIYVCIYARVCTQRYKSNHNHWWLIRVQMQPHDNKIDMKIIAKCATSKALCIYVFARGLREVTGTAMMKLGPVITALRQLTRSNNSGFSNWSGFWLLLFVVVVLVLRGVVCLAVPYAAR